MRNWKIIYYHLKTWISDIYSTECLKWYIVPTCDPVYISWCKINHTTNPVLKLMTNNLSSDIQGSDNKACSSVWPANRCNKQSWAIHLPKMYNGSSLTRRFIFVLSDEKSTNTQPFGVPDLIENIFYLKTQKWTLPLPTLDLHLTYFCFLQLEVTTLHVWEVLRLSFSTTDSSFLPYVFPTLPNARSRQLIDRNELVPLPEPIEILFQWCDDTNLNLRTRQKSYFIAIG